MKVLVVDDELAARERLTVMLEELEVGVAGQASNGMEAIEQVASQRPDVILLDIEMPEVDGFDVVRHLQEPKPLVIFQTAYDEFALKAFDHEAVDYVIKPVTLERLERALERAARRMQEAHATPAPEILERLRTTLSRTNNARRPRVLVREGKSRRLLPLREILFFQLEDGLVEAHTESRSYLTDYTLPELETRTGDSFSRVNRSELINLDHVHRIESHGDGTATLSLSTGALIHVSRRRAGEVKQALET